MITSVQSVPRHDRFCARALADCVSCAAKRLNCFACSSVIGGLTELDRDARLPA